jgi:ferredoxin-NADP reductase
MFGLLKSHRLIYQDRHDVGGGVTSLVFRSEKAVTARAGQHGFLQLGPTTMKPFSLASAPEEEYILIGTSLAAGSAVKKRLAALRPGDAVTFRGPINNFTLDRLTGPIVMLAQGVGITPFRSMLAHIAHGGLAVDSSLIHVANAGHAYRAETERWATRAAYPRHSDEFRSAVRLATRVDPKTAFYVAGASAFVSSTAALLRDCGVAQRNIRQDKYLGYRPAVREATVHAAGTGTVQVSEPTQAHRR